MELDFRLLFPEDFMTALLDEGLREDGRKFDEVRTTTINIGSVNTANGSAIVRVGNTCVMCGIQAMLSNPHPMSPNDGFMVFNVDYSHLCSKIVGQLTSSSISQTIQDLLLSSKVIDLKDLCISEGKLCWTLLIDTLILSVDGPPLDACVLATMSALRDVKLPKVSVDSGTPEVSMAMDTSLKCGVPPLMISFAIHQKLNMLVDPTETEVSVCPGLLSIAVLNSNTLAGVYKFGGPSMTSKQIENCIKIAKSQCQAYHKLIDKTISD